MHFSKKSGRLSSTGSEILIIGNHCSANFQTILDCFIRKFKLEYEDLEKIKTDRVHAVVFNLHQIKRLKSFLGHPVQMAQVMNPRYTFLHNPPYSFCEYCKQLLFQLVTVRKSS